MTIAVVGSINMDVTAYMYRLPKPGETLHGKDYIVGLGGKGANQAVAATKLGSDVAFIGRIGADDFGKSAERALKYYGLDLSLIAKDHDGATGIAIINVGEGGENYISVIAGSNFHVDVSDVEMGRAALEQAKVLLLQLEVPLEASLAAAAIVRAHGGTVILDPAPAKDLDPSVLRAIDIITPNEAEAGQLLGWQPRTPEEGLRAAKELRARGVATAVVKLGGKGLAVAGEGIEKTLPAFKVTPIDTVAAGDSFNGGLAHALEQGQGIEMALRYAAACGALSTTRMGAAEAAPTSAEVEAFLSRA
ncbi:ribokinase [Aestuariivirga sp.]|uniref:ribokinase n=1 Tax=Aestuariivirga sp. TaxID=2650926 RepID=UPI0025BC188B|nr:ribokinase [Aestuariivirga sp.]MCA3554711.1 ribokinase [Aestuariivirga sp.]